MTDKDMETSCGAVLYTVVDDCRLYHLVRNRGGHIGFPKGHMEPGESEPETALREIHEETGTQAILDTGFRHEYSYALPNGDLKRAVYFLGSYPADSIVVPINADPSPVVIPASCAAEVEEAWLADFPSARNLLTFEQERNLLDAAETWISRLDQ